MTKQVEAFKLTVPDTDIADLRKRLRRTRFPDQAPGPGWAYGTDVAWMRGLIDYWGEKFDWRAQEDRLNAFPQYKVRLHDIDLHFLHVEEQGPERDWLFILAILRAHAQVVASSCECQDSHPDRLALFRHHFQVTIFYKPIRNGNDLKSSNVCKLSFALPKIWVGSFGPAHRGCRALRLRSTTIRGCQPPLKWRDPRPLIWSSDSNSPKRTHIFW